MAQAIQGSVFTKANPPLSTRTKADKDKSNFVI